MDRLIYTAFTAMDAAMNRQRAVANNLANASTPGFKAEEFAVTPATLKGDTLEVRALAQGAVRGANLAAGRILPTGRNLDIAVEHNALIALQGRDGEEVYTRRGDLRITATGVLENGDGLPVMGEGGAITIPPGGRVSIAGDGGVFVSDPAAGPGEPAEQVGRIKLVSPEGSAIFKGLDNLLRVPGGGALPVDPTASVRPGSLEASNVDTATTLVQMIEAQRAFEQRSMVIEKAGELDRASTMLMSLNR